VQEYSRRGGVPEIFKVEELKRCEERREREGR
jgi:hypothetical protein